MIPTVILIVLYRLKAKIYKLFADHHIPVKREENLRKVLLVIIIM